MSERNRVVSVPYREGRYKRCFTRTLSLSAVRSVNRRNGFYPFAVITSLLPCESVDVSTVSGGGYSIWSERHNRVAVARAPRVRRASIARRESNEPTNR